MKNNIPIFSRITALLFVVITVWYSFYMVQPPSPKDRLAPDTEFSAERAFTHVKALGQHPHPVGSAEHDSARQYVIDELEALELNPETREGIQTRQFGSTAVAASLKNIFVKIPGSNPTNTIMLMAHYDSVPNGKGGADDASGIAAILETLRAVKAHGPLKNNVWILITDGEELGLLGAELFVNTYPGIDQVDLVLNVEARGTKGASFMFETNSNNASLVPLFAEAASHPVANSLTYTVYQLLPNDTDMSVTKRAGIQGLNFAIVEDYLDYHTLQDAPEHLSPASLQHQGENLLSNLAYFGNREFDLQADRDLVYFNNLTGGIAYYPASWSLPLALAAFLFLAGYMAFLIRTGQVKSTRFLISVLVHLAVLAGGVLITYFGWQLIRLVHPEYRWLVQGETYNHLWYLWGFSFLVLAWCIGIYGWIRDKWNLATILSGIYTIWILASLAAAWYLPTASYLLTIPVLFGLLGWVVLGNPGNESSRTTLLLLMASLLPALYIVSPYIRQIQVTLTTSMLAASMLLLLFIAGLSWPLVEYIIPRKFIYAALGLGILFLGCIAGAALNSGYDKQHRKQNNVNYALDFDTNEAYWVSSDHATDPWTRQFLGDDPASGSLNRFSLLRGTFMLKETIPVAGPDEQPGFSIISTENIDSLRSLTVEFGLPNFSRAVVITSNNELYGIKINKQPVINNKGRNTQPFNRILYFSPLKGPLTFDMTLRADTVATELQFEWVNDSLPVYLLENPYQPRSSRMMPVPKQTSDASIFKITYPVEID